MAFNEHIRPLTAERLQSMLHQYVPATACRPEISADALELYAAALCHESYVVRDDKQRSRANQACPPRCVPLGRESYERLEFLGDAIFGAIVTAYLFKRYAAENEGFMTRMRVSLVNGKMLARLCERATKLVPHIAVSKQVEDASRTNASVQPIGKKRARHLTANVLEDVFEAFVGAMYTHMGYDFTAQWVVRCLERNIDFAELAAAKDAPHAVLNRHYHKSSGFIPVVEKLGEGHARLMNPLTGQVIATGRGETQKEAVNDAVKKALAYSDISCVNATQN